ncbi:glycoside hydrolase family 43 protein [Streptomyces sp. KR80]|uniref:glycoside hydrolase family 43 protein n=1 Tax=Streptomyces sp. KR80 TaxID=3457426 RepID=UPI003FCEF2A7
MTMQRRTFLSVSAAGAAGVGLSLLAAGVAPAAVGPLDTAPTTPAAPFAVSAAPAAPGPPFTNPLVGTPNSADPSIVYSGGNWYYVATTWSSKIIMRRSSTMAGLKTAAEHTVFTLAPGPGCCRMWAPDLQWINNRWYLYFSAAASPGQGERRTGVLESSGTDPMGPYTYRGILNLEPNSGWAIDGSVVRFNGRVNHFVYSAFRGGEQGLFIAPMSSPTQVSRNGVRISSPRLSWERQGGAVNEGPYAVYNAGKTFLTYSASSCQTPDYKLGMLTWTGGDPMSASSWTKMSTPIFQRSDANGVYGPGHASFVRSPDNTETWVVYHANSSTSEGCGTTRTTRAQKINWNSDGSPNLGVPVRTGTSIEGPSGDS